MFAAGDRPSLQLRGLADRPRHAAADGFLRAQVQARLRVLTRLVVVGGALLALPAMGALVRAVSRGAAAKRARTMRATQAICRAILRVLNIHCRFVDLHGRSYSGHDRLLLVANHMSYLDVVLIAAHIPAVFITSREIESTPILGGVSRGAGCLFVERRRIAHVHQDVDQLSVALNQGANVMLFPEGSTSDETAFLRFKSTLVEAAIRSRATILPLCVRYLAVDGAPFGDANRDHVAWYGDMTFFPHFVRLLGTRRIDCELVVLPSPAFRDHKCRKRVTRDIRRQLAAVYARTP